MAYTSLIRKNDEILYNGIAEMFNVDVCRHLAPEPKQHYCVLRELCNNFNRKYYEIFALLFFDKFQGRWPQALRSETKTIPTDLAGLRCAKHNYVLLLRW
uniref:Uncharacterized protein n=1 Tax=Glossina palpalis gambiensis TaxID=67801 RepID=A0A1B0BZD7_9MUSC